MIQLESVLIRFGGQNMLDHPVRPKLQAVSPFPPPWSCLDTREEETMNCWPLANFLCIPEDAGALKLVGILKHWSHVENFRDIPGGPLAMSPYLFLKCHSRQRIFVQW